MKSNSKQISIDILNFAKKIFNINRSLTGKGNRKTLFLIKKEIKNLKLKSFPSNKKVFDWVIPLEWKINNGFIITPDKKKICEFKKNFLHVISYSQPIKKYLSLSDLKKNLITLKNKPHSIPYATTYYRKKWGFCISYNQFKKLKKGKYFVHIDSKHFKGNLDYGELIIPGKSSKEILLSTYICHPNLANNETSGISLLTFICKWIKQKKRNFTYRIIFTPETIGSISYIHKNLKQMKKKVIAGYILTCVGDNRNFSYLRARDEYSLTNKVALNVLKSMSLKSKIYDWSYRGSDERQYCYPKVDLPLVAFSRSKAFPEYHTNKDNFDLVTEKGLEGSLEIFKNIISAFETNLCPKTNFISMKGLEFIFLGMGSVLGAFLRYKLTESPLIFNTLPVNVLIVNIAGAFILGVFVVVSQQWHLDSKYSLFAAVGFCGSLTTMSAFALDSSNLLESNQYISFIVNIFTNVGLSIAALIGGKSLMTAIINN